MLYAMHQFQRLVLDGSAAISGAIAKAGVPWWSAQAALVHRMTRPYPKPRFEIAGFDEEVVIDRPFVRLLRFAPQQTRATTLPRVLVVAPLSGHHATLVRDTIATLLIDHDVCVTDWRDAREVPISVAASFSLDDYIAEIRGFLAHLGSIHVVAVCQPTVPVLAAVALDAAAGVHAAAPRSLVLMGGPVDARVNPTVVDKLATDHPLAWFESMMIHRVPAGFAGAGRRVYPGFLQLAAFVAMNPDDHARAYLDYWLAQLRADGDAIAKHERFYDEYNAVLDMDAAYYLDTVRTVFQEFALARGTWRVAGTLVEPAAIARTALLAVEGELDDISGVGQTAAALALCTGVADKVHFVADGCGHYGLFSGTRWRTQIYPRVRDFIGAHA